MSGLRSDLVGPTFKSGGGKSQDVASSAPIVGSTFRSRPDVGISPREFLRRHLEPRLQYGPTERDMIVVRVDVAGTSDGRRSARRYELIDYRDLRTGTLAMSRAVGVPASVVAQMILSGDIGRPGVASPIRDIPPGPFFDALARRGITISEREIDPGACYAAPPS